MSGVPLRRLGASELPPVCRRSQAVLLEFAELGQSSPELRRALDHLAACDECEHAMAQTAMVLSALRRLADDASQVQPSPQSFTRVRVAATAERRGIGPAWHSAGLVAGLALLLVLVVPKAVLQPREDVVSPVEPQPTLDATWYVSNPARHGPIVISRALEVSDMSLPINYAPQGPDLQVSSSKEHVK